MTAWERCDGILDPRFIRLGADFGGVHDLVETNSIQASLVVRFGERNIWHANIEKVRSETTDKLFEGDLEKRRQNDRPICSNDCVARIPGRFNPELGDDVGDDRYSDGYQTGQP